MAIFYYSVVVYKLTVKSGQAGDLEPEQLPSVHVTLHGTRGDSGARLLHIANDRSPKFNPDQVNTIDSIIIYCLINL